MIPRDRGCGPDGIARETFHVIIPELPPLVLCVDQGTVSPQNFFRADVSPIEGERHRGANVPDVPARGHPLR